MNATKMTTKHQPMIPRRPLAVAVVFCSSLTLTASVLELNLIGRFGHAPPDLDDEDAGDDLDYFDGSAAEIPTYDPVSQRLFVTNAVTASVDVISIADPENPTLEFSILVADDPKVEGDPKTEPGVVPFFDADGQPVAPPVTVGVLPDAITASPDGNWIVTYRNFRRHADDPAAPSRTTSARRVSSSSRRRTARTEGRSSWSRTR